MFKKLIALALAMVMVCTLFVACGDKTSAKANYEGTMEELVNAIVETAPVEFMGGLHPIDLADTTEDGLWAVKSYTGLANADKLAGAVAYESMMGSQAFSLVLVQVKDAADAEAVAQEMYDNIDTRKWICVGADQKAVAGSGDVVMLIMLDTGLSLDVSTFLNAFSQVMGGNVDFTLN